MPSPRLNGRLCDVQLDLVRLALFGLRRIKFCDRGPEFRDLVVHILDCVLHVELIAADLCLQADALFLRNYVIERFERADVETDPQRKAQLLTFVIIGGGLVGVELLGELSAFVDGIVPLYTHVNRNEVRLVLLQGADRIMPEIDPMLAEYGARVLAARPGVEVRTNIRVQAIGPHTVHMANETIAADTIVLAAGVVPSPVISACWSKRTEAAECWSSRRCMREPRGSMGAWRLRRDPWTRRQTVSGARAACNARGESPSREHP